MKTTTGSVGSRASWEGLRCRLMSDAPCDWPCAACLEVQSNPQSVFASFGPWYAWEGPRCAQGWLPPAPSLGVGQQKAQGTLSSPSTCHRLLGSVTERATGCTRVTCSFPVSHQVGASVIHQTETDSNSLPLLGLRPPSKFPECTKASCHLSSVQRPL